MINEIVNDRIASVHLKDRQTPAHGAGILPWGTGDTPLKEILQVMKNENYTFPASIQLQVRRARGVRRRQGSRGNVSEYCKAAL